MSGRLVRALLAGGIAVALFAACSDDGGGDSGGGGTTDDPGADLTGEPIKLMVTGAFDAFGADYSQVPAAAKAAADAIEADGGINGSPIEIIECNQASANEASDCARQAVEEGVIATVGTFSSYAADTLPILQEAGIPQVAPYLVGFDDYTSPINYPVMGGTLSAVAGMGAQLADGGASTMNVTYLDIGPGALAADLADVGAEPRDAEVISKTPVPEGTVDFSPVVAEATEGDPEGVAMLLTNRDAPGYVRSLEQSGFEGDIAASTSSFTPSQLEELGDTVEGLAVPNSFLPATYTENEAVQQFNDEIDTYAGDIVKDDAAQNSWLGVHLIDDLMEGANEVTAATLTEALDTTGPIDLGLLPPISFQQGTMIEALAPGVELRVYNPTVVYTVVEDGELVAVDGEFVNPLEA
jgi:ABC-type branched-subunit amino acid transport system substrate-binding protein